MFWPSGNATMVFNAEASVGCRHGHRPIT